MKNRPLHKRLGFAVAGLRDGWRRERSFRTHVVSAVLVIAAMCLLRPTAVWWAIITLAIALVLAIELINSALEALADHLHPERHPQIRIMKDLAAGAVLVVAIAAVLVGIALALGSF